MKKEIVSDKLVLIEAILKALFFFCAICCFITILPLPIFYYTFLRILVFVVSVVVIYYFWKQKEFQWVGVFGTILILFNPIVPIHFYLKRIWMPIDIITGILFLLLVFIKRKREETLKATGTESSIETKTFSRDRIVKSTLKNNNNHE